MLALLGATADHRPRKPRKEQDSRILLHEPSQQQVPAAQAEVAPRADTSLVLNPNRTLLQLTIIVKVEAMSCWFETRLVRTADLTRRVSDFTQTERRTRGRASMEKAN